MPVWHGYQWLVPLALELIGKYWPAHPPIFLAGLTAEEAGAHDHVPVSDPARRANWSWMAGDGARQVAGLGFRQAYVIAEEHVPLAPCHEEHLNQTLPAWGHDLDAVYISLMGWDNRRYSSKSPRLPREFGRMMHLQGKGDPRFHLHPALWRLDAFIRCCELARATGDKNGSAWHFEKVNDRLDADLPEAWKKGCYQIAAGELRLRERSRIEAFAGLVERFAFNKLMAFYPLIRPRAAANAFARAVGFDDFFCEGPYPMFYSGLMAKGGINRYAARYLQKSPEGSRLLSRLAARQRAASSRS